MVMVLVKKITIIIKAIKAEMRNIRSRNNANQIVIKIFKQKLTKIDN